MIWKRKPRGFVATGEPTNRELVKIFEICDKYLPDIAAVDSAATEKLGFTATRLFEEWKPKTWLGCLSEAIAERVHEKLKQDDA